MDALFQSLFHPTEIYALLKYKLSPAPKLSAKGSTAKCFKFLNETSRSFARVIQELHQDLCLPVAIFYLVLRGLDTVEDVRTFYKKLHQKGWNFDGNSVQEKDRHLLVGFDVVIDEFLTLEPKYQEVIVDITKRMGEGMAHFIENDVKTLDDYDLYTHYVAGLVGIGLTQLFVASGLESPQIGKELDSANEMGLFLQKTNILKDFLTDLEEDRLFWPECVWKKYAVKVDELADPKNLDKALGCLNELCVNAMELVPSCLDYLSKIKDPTVFKFCAIPQLMAIASMDHFYNNPCMFQVKGNKIRRGTAVKIIQQATDMSSVALLYKKYALSLNEKARANMGKNPYDESSLDMSFACANIVRWVNAHTRPATSNLWLYLTVLVVLVSLLPIVQ